MIPIIAMGVATAGVAVAGFVTRSNRRSAWAEAADALGCNFVSPQGLAGHVQGLAVRTSVVRRPVGSTRSRRNRRNNQRPEFTRFEVLYPSVGVAVKLTKDEPVLFKWGADKPDLIIGDRLFDDRVVVESPNPQATRRFLSPARRMAVIALFERYLHVSVSGHELIAEVRGVATDPQDIVNTVRQLVDIGRVISAPTAVDLALQKQAEGDLAGAVHDLHEVNTPPAPHNTFNKMLEYEALMASADGERAAEVMKELDRDEQLDGWSAVARKYPSPPARPGRTSQAPTGPSEAVIIAELFGPQRGGYETEDYFMSKYHGAEVRWSGVVERVREFRSDAVFDGAGLRALITIGRLGQGAITDEVTAIVQLPPETQLSAGAEVTFEGVMVRVDRYMRNIYLADGSIVVG